MEALIQNKLWLFVLATLWVLPWKAYSLWTAAKRHHKGWFIALVILNTFAVLDIFYIFYIAKKTPTEVLGAVKRVFKK